MAQADLRAYLALLDGLREELRRLTGIEQEKVTAVHNHDLAALNDCMKREQAAALALRGREQQRDALLKALGLEGVALRELPQRCPPEWKGEAARAVEALLRDYAVLKSVQSPARELMERELKTVNDALEKRGVAPELDGQYQPAGQRPPAPFRTDFRA